MKLQLTGDSRSAANNLQKCLTTWVNGFEESPCAASELKFFQCFENKVNH